MNTKLWIGKRGESSFVEKTIDSSALFGTALNRAKQKSAAPDGFRRSAVCASFGRSCYGCKVTEVGMVSWKKLIVLALWSVMNLHFWMIPRVQQLSATLKCILSKKGVWENYEKKFPLRSLMWSMNITWINCHKGMKCHRCSFLFNRSYQEFPMEEWKVRNFVSQKAYCTVSSAKTLTCKDGHVVDKPDNKMDIDG